MNRAHVILLLAAFVVTGEAAAQDLGSDVRVSWLKQHAIAVRTLDPADQDFRDLQPLKEVIGDARIVMLGEISHGDGSTLLAKSRLVKFLHRQMDFDVLVFESPFYDMAKVWESIRDGNEPVGAVRRGMMRAWSYSPQVSDLMDYVGRSAKSARPLELAGLDLQPLGISRDSLLTDLDAYAARFGVSSDLTSHESRARALAADLFTPTGPGTAARSPAPDPASRQLFFDSVELLAQRLASATTPANRTDMDFWRQVLTSSLRSYAEMTWWDREHDRENREWVSFNMRDRQNADNLLWLADHKYRGKKIIVWGATAHLMRNAPSIEPNIDPAQPRRPYMSMRTMGGEVARRIGSQAFMLGFTSFEGTNAFGNPDELVPIQKDQHSSIELEELFNAARFDYAIVDFRKPAANGNWLRTPIISRPLGNEAMRAIWPDVMDALFFIRVMEPNTASPRVPAGRR